MVWHDKVVWQEGMFLRAQHFQQQDRYVEHLLEARAAPLRPHPWGVTELTIDRDLLAAGRFALSAATGIMEDGTPFSIPGGADAPLPLDLPEGTRNAAVYLAVPLRQDGSPEVTASELSADAARARFGLRSFEAFDTHSDSTMAAELGIGRCGSGTCSRRKNSRAIRAWGWPGSSRSRRTGACNWMTGSSRPACGYPRPSF